MRHGHPQNPLRLTKIVKGKKDILRQALLWQLGKLVPYSGIIDLLWGLDEDGGPFQVTNSIHQYVIKLRKDGYEIECQTGVGMRMIKVGDIQTSKR